jgi:hypothetical protein
VNAALIYRSSPLLNHTVATFTDKGVLISDGTLNVVAVYGGYSKEYFLEYECEKEEKIPITKNFLEKLSAFNEEKIQVYTEGNNIIVKSNKREYSEPMMDVEHPEFPFPMVNAEYGMVPKKLNVKVQVKLNADELANLPKADYYKFKADSNNFYAVVEDIGKYTEKLTVIQCLKTEPFEVILDAEYLQHILNNINGEFWLMLQKEAVIFSQKTQNYSLTYLLSTREEEE